MRGLVVLLCALLAPAAGAQPPDFIRLAREQAPAVVSIAAAYAPPVVLPDVPHDAPQNDFLDRLAILLAPDFELRALGSGFLIGSDGTILTNFHVVEEAYNEEVIVRLADQREFLGRVAGIDPETDIALVKIEATALPQVRIGDPQKLQVGEWVATIGAPFGFERSMAAGIVSATARSLPTATTHVPLIQTDVAMNPGHSGGPLFNVQGEVIGLNSLIFSNTGASIGVSFAIPIDAAMQIAGQLREHGRIRRGRIGVRAQELSAELARALRLAQPAGALVTEVTQGAPAEAAGIRAGDVIVQFGGAPVGSPAELMQRVAGAAADTTVAVDLVRNGKPLRLPVRVAASEYTPYRLRDAGGTDRLGLLLAPLTELQRRRVSLPAGLVVQRAEGAARRAGLFPGDVILSVNARSTPTLEAFRAAVEQALPGDAVALLVHRPEGRAFVALRMPP